MNNDSNTSQIKADPDDEIIHIFKDTEDSYVFEEDKHKASSELLSAIAGERNYIPSKCTYAQTLPLAAFASLLIEIVARLEHVIEAVQELGKLAAFQP